MIMGRTIGNLMNRKQAGFTLVELAVVLVIIGLLLGGILKGQELVNSARVRNLADHNSGVQAAYFGFIDRYRQVPGDMLATPACQAIGKTKFAVPPSACSAATVGGNGNGSLDNNSATDQHFKEASALWAHLSASGFIQGSFTGGATSASTYNNNTGAKAPLNAFNGRVMLTSTNQYMDTSTNPPYRLAYIFGNQTPVGIMRELDVKIDDTLPATGVLRHTNNTTAGEVVQSSSSCVTGSGVSAIWNIDGDDQNCNALYFY